VQVHGSAVVDVGSDGDAVGKDGLREGDAGLAADETTCAAILVADCVPIAIGSPEGIRVAIHGGWRGLAGGVVANAAAAAGAAGASRLVAGIGPCIGPCCYEFSEPDLAEVEARLGPGVRARTRLGTPALDIRAAARNLLSAAGAEIAYEEQSCTSCGSGWFSARGRSDKERQALYLWRGDL
jgi:polyphenol oxidase